MPRPLGPRLYNLFPRLIGPVAAWHRHLERIAAMGFDWVFVNPFHQTGFSGSLYAVKDPYRLDPAFRGRSRKEDGQLIADFVADARAHGLAVMMDLVINHTAKDAPLVAEHPEWFVRDASGEVVSPSAIDPADATRVTVWGDLAEIDYRERPERAAIAAYWADVVRYHARLGIAGFRCDAAYKVPAAVWSALIGAAREVVPDAVFAAETLGCRLEEVAALAPAGFDYLFNSAKWWDFRAPWLLEQYRDHRRIAPSIAFPESHDTERLVAELAGHGVNDPAEIEAHYRLRYAFAAAFSTGVMMPVGYEFGFARRLDVVATKPADWEEPRFDLSSFIAEANAVKTALPALNEEGPQAREDLAAGAVALIRSTEDGGDRVVTAIHPEAGRPVPIADLARGRRLAAVLSSREGRLDGETVPEHLRPIELLLLHEESAGATSMTKEPRGEGAAAIDTSRLKSRPIVIQNVYPELDCGRFPVKREVGDTLEVWADVFREGHDRLAAVVRYQADPAEPWREAPMRLVEPGLDRWMAALPLERNGRLRFTVEAWTDRFESWRDELGKKREAGQPIALEVAEGRELVAAAAARADDADRKRLEQVLREVAVAETDDAAALMMSTLVQRIMARWPDRSDACRYDRELEVVVDRPAARFAAWYEMFPRSQGTVPGRSATFDDCIERLPEIRAMGFDVVYLVPIHPIGRTNRKGRNNATVAGPDDPGSPYAIGGPEGGHRAVHPELGTLDDFRRFVRAARDLEMEVALDFAIQCSPDHPWIREHPEWFVFRPDGSIKHAENPPKKYEDIVNVNFFGPHRDALWRELRDTLLFWVDQGVETFRVDNPHTKPVPFWEWVIREVQERNPRVIFLSEAFTRPKMLTMLAKVGFSQSYTYFTWRNFKEELITYFTELTQTEVKEYLRPNLFTNTPDILPFYLQTGGRPAFMIRLVLAATLSSVYGIYNGYELCENRALPGREEYADSEKYEYKVWDWDRPGNIKDYIAAVNRIRRDNPALHELENLRFYACDSDDVIFYGKMTPARDNIVFIAVNLDPFEAHRATLSFPLEAMGIPENETFEVEELLTGERHFWRGAEQHVALDPAVNPAAIFRVTPWEHVEFRTPCF